MRTRVWLLCTLFTLAACGDDTSKLPDAPTQQQDAASPDAPAAATLSITRTGASTGHVTSTPAGIDCGATCSKTFAIGSVVTLSATADAGGRFAGWSGGGCSGMATCDVTVTADVAVTATFETQTFSVDLTLMGSGMGTVVSTPTGISCPGVCSMTAAIGTDIVLTATPSDAMSSFLGWAGPCSGTSTCSITLTQDVAVTAAFTMLNDLVVIKNGTGSGTITSNPPGIDCGTDCMESYLPNTAVVLTAAADVGSTFTGWSGGGCTGMGPCTVTMVSALMVTGTFDIEQDTLTVTRAGMGTGTVTSVPAGINCGTVCSKAYDYGTMVTLTATPTVGGFSGWSGACSGTGTCTVTMDAAKSVIATFVPNVTITVARTGVNSSGALVTSMPPGITCGATCSGSFAPGTVVTLTQVPGGGVFNTWLGAGCSGTGTCVFTVGAALTVTATYRQLRVGLEAPTSSCLRQAGNVFPVLTSLLTGRGHSVTVVAGTDIDTAAEIAAYDVIVLPGPGSGACNSPDYSTFDGVVDNYVRINGGGVVGSGWFLFGNFGAPQIVGILPTVANMNYLSGVRTVTTVAGHPITNGVGAFTTNEWLPTAGGPKPGATSLLSVGAISAGAAWTVGTGRSVYAGPMFAEDFTSYDNESLTNGTQPAAIEIFMRSIEWSGKAR